MALGDLFAAVAEGDPPPVQRMIREGRASITETDEDGHPALFVAAKYGHYKIMHWLLAEGGASIEETDRLGDTVLLYAISRGQLLMTQLLLEHGGASMAAVDIHGESVWDLLEGYVGTHANHPAHRPRTIALLRAMLLRGDTPPGYADRLTEYAQMVREGVRLRARLPAYVAERRALLDAHCPLLPPLRALVHGYEEPTSTEELWATGLGADP